MLKIVPNTPHVNRAFRTCFCLVLLAALLVCNVTSAQESSPRVNFDNADLETLQALQIQLNDAIASRRGKKRSTNPYRLEGTKLTLQGVQQIEPYLRVIKPAERSTARGFVRFRWLVEAKRQLSWREAHRLNDFRVYLSDADGVRLNGAPWGAELYLSRDKDVSPDAITWIGLNINKSERFWLVIWLNQNHLDVAERADILGKVA